MFPKNKEYLYNKDGMKVGIFLELETYEEILEKLRHYEEAEDLLEELEDLYFGEIALQRLKEYKEGKLKTYSLEEVKERLGIEDEVHG